MKNIILFFAASFLLISCQETQRFNTCNGVWASIGHGQILEIKDSLTYAYYDITSISCVHVRESNFSEIEPVISVINDTLSLIDGPIVYEFTRLDQLPMLCANEMDEIKTKDPIYNFEVFMETVKEHYAYLELNDINWDELYKTQRGKLNSNSTAVDLFLIIEETFEKLNDNHAFLDADDVLYEALDQLPIEESEEEEEEEYGDFPTAEKVFVHFVEEDMTKDSWLIKWGKTKGMGYVQIKAMWLFADLDLLQEELDRLGFFDAFANARSNMFSGNYIRKEVEGVEKIMDRVMIDFADTKSIILDVRFNGGGQDLVSTKILSYFNPSKLKIATTKFRYGKKHTKAKPQYLESNPAAYKQPVYVLTSPQSGSAAEIFALATLAMTNVKRIGSQTEGAMSTTLDKKLPIGWDFCVSNEIFQDNDGKFYENEGVPVDYELHYNRERQAFFGYVLNNLERDKQEVLRAIKELEKE